MSGNRMTYVILTIVLLVAVVGWKMTSRSAYESARFTVVKSDGPFEIREYPDLMMATTAMDSRRTDGGDGSFSRLFGYITGANEGKQKVAMTTPVFMESDDDEPAGQMGFVIPNQVAFENRIPNPTRNDVQIRKRAGGRFATLRFTGRLENDAAEAEEKLRQWIQQNDLKIDGAVELAGYDPPWTPGPLRRNEVLIRLQAN